MAAKTNKNNKGKEKRSCFSFFSDMTPERKSNILKYTGVAVAVLAAFSFISVVSYLFTWKADQSLMADPAMMDRGVEVANWAGKVGYKWAALLVGDCFGLGAFALIFLLCACGYRLFCWDRSIGLLRLSFLSVSGAFLSSLILAYCSIRVSNDVFFGGGLGGDAGHAVILWMENLFGGFVSAFILIALSIAWLLSASGSFAAWFSELGKKKESVEDPVVETVQEEVQEAAEESELVPDFTFDMDPEQTEQSGEDVIQEAEPETESGQEMEPEILNF